MKLDHVPSSCILVIRVAKGLSTPKGESISPWGRQYSVYTYIICPQ